MLEEYGYYDEKGFRFINDLQKELLLIPQQLKPIGTKKIPRIEIRGLYVSN